MKMIIELIILLLVSKMENSKWALFEDSLWNLDDDLSLEPVHKVKESSQINNVLISNKGTFN